MLPMYPVTITQLLGNSYHLEQAFWETVQAKPEDTVFFDCTAGPITMSTILREIRRTAEGKTSSRAVIHRPDLAVYQNATWEHQRPANQQGWANYLPTMYPIFRRSGVSVVGLFPHDRPVSSWEWRASVRGIITPAPIQGEWDIEFLKYRIR